jgi:hypothetical protein
MPIFFILFEEIFSIEKFPLVNLAIALHFLEDKVVACSLVIMIVGIKIPHDLVSLKSFFFELLKDSFLIKHVVESNYEALRFTYRFERILEPSAVTDTLWG